jgi:hypothetical protein
MKRFVFFGLFLSVLVFSSWAMASIVPNGTIIRNNRKLDYHILGGTMANTPDYEWWYGCSPTSAGMMMGYYDNNGYSNLVPGVAEMDTHGNPGANVNNIIASSDHVADFYTGYMNSGDDPLASGRSIPSGFNCLADFMGTSQDSVTNPDGASTFYNWNDGSPFYESDAFNYGVSDKSGMYGIGEYIDYTGYDAQVLYNQYIDNMGMMYGFTLAQYQAEIDAGKPVMIHIEGHSMLGYGYLDGTDTIQVRDTWASGGMFNNGLMTWGGYYGGSAHYAVTALTIVPEPGSLALLALGLLLVRRRHSR